MSPGPAEQRAAKEDDRDARRGASTGRARSASMDDDAPRSNGAAERRDLREAPRDSRDLKENQQEHGNSDRRKVIHPFIS